MRLPTYTSAEIRAPQSERKYVRNNRRQASQSPPEKPPAKRLKRVYRRMSTSPSMQGSPMTTPDKKSRTGRQNFRPSKGAESSFETDSDAPISSTRRRTLKKAMLTPALTEDKEAPTPKILITLDSSSEDERPSQKGQKGGNTRVVEAEDSSPRIKVEKGLPTAYGLLSQEICQKTTLLVTADHEKDKAPITIALPQCRSSDDLFDRLVRESELPNDLARRVKSVSATYKWNGRRLRLRKSHAEDWHRFQKEVSQGWGSGVLGEEGEVEMMIHVGG